MKEGVGVFFLMVVVNDCIMCFVCDYDLLIVMFGFGDCIGGVQVSMVMYFLVENYYFFGINMLFVGQIVMFLYLLLMLMFLNYLLEMLGVMIVFVRYFFVSDFDEWFYEIDLDILVLELLVEQVFECVFEGKVLFEEEVSMLVVYCLECNCEKIFCFVQKVFIYGCGCIVVKFVQVVQQCGIDVVFVQLDLDMDLLVVCVLCGDSMFVCFGGSMLDESYFNVYLVICIVEVEGVDLLYFGIGFFFESVLFVDFCVWYDFNFIGLSVEVMEWMGNKLNVVQMVM